MNWPRPRLPRGRLGGLTFAAFVLAGLVSIPGPRYVGPFADNDRSRSAVLALLADNVSGDISAQDLRDALVSGTCYAGLYTDDNTVTTQTVTSTPATFTVWEGDFPESCADGDYTADGVTLPAYAADWKIDFSISFFADTAAEFQFHAALDGVELSECGLERKIATAGQAGVGAAGFTCIVTAAASDVVTIQTEVDSGSVELTPFEADLSVVRVDM